MMEDERQPPPLFGDDDDGNDNDDDLFKTPLDTKPPPSQSEPAVDNHNIFEDVTEEVPIRIPEKRHNEPHGASSTILSEPLGASGSSHSEPLGAANPLQPDPFSSTSKAAAASPETPSSSSKGAEPTASKAPPGFRSAGKPTDKRNEKVEDSRHEIKVTVTSPKKMGDGVGAYMVYKVNTKTQIPDFRKSDMEVYRRFSDFLGLHEKLVLKHQHNGCIIPPPPEKSVIGMTKIKMASEDAGSAEFIERRRSALERYINRVAAHPDLQTDPAFVDFLEVEGDLPRATSTSALSSAGVLRLFSRVGESIVKSAIRVDETDQWFEEKTLQLETLDLQLKMLQGSIDTLVMHRRDLAVNSGQFTRSIASLASREEHTALSRALSQLAEVEEKVESVHSAQADADFYILDELVRDYVGMVQAVKEALDERVKRHREWKDNEVNLAKKREVKVRMELAHKTDKINEANREISEWEQRVERSQEDFETISKRLRVELERFDRQRCRDFKASIVVYLESLMNTQQQLIKHWELFLPEAKAVI